MKLKSLDFRLYRHLSDLNFDFRYPENHPNAGKPLEKICLIGQSATGKTSILDLIKESLKVLDNAEIVEQKYLLSNLNTGFDGSITFSTDNDDFKLSNNGIEKGVTKFTPPTGGGSGILSKLVQDPIKLIYLGSDIITQNAIQIFNKNPIELNSSYKQTTSETQNTENRYLSDSFFFEFSASSTEETWLLILKKILAYRSDFTQLASELIQKGDIADLAKLNKQFQEWAVNNKNPLEGFSKAVNPVLSKLHLEIDLINTNYPVPIKLKSREKVVPISHLSTGTKSLLFSLYPLFELNTDNSIIIVDEPERSLFPDIQMEIISVYKELAPNAQIIVATHSPFIAASFDPEERFILEFDNSGKVSMKKGVSPIGDDPNDMTRQDFNVDYYNKFGKDAYEDYLKLKQKIQKESDPTTKEELIVEMSELGDKYNF